MNTYRRIREILAPAERKGAWVLLALMFVGMAVETIGIGVIVPVIALLTDGGIPERYPQLQPLIRFLGNPTQAQLVTRGVLALSGVYLVKALYLAFLGWQLNKYVADVRVQLSQRLFATYLRQPYTFHLQRNSAQLLRNVSGEVGIFGALLTQSLTLTAEIMVVLGVAALLLAVEPVGAIIVGLVLGTASVSFYYATRASITRWGVARQHHEGLRIQHLQQGLGGAKDVKLLGRERDFLTQHEVHHVQSARVGLLQAVLGSLPRLWLELLAVFGLSILVLTMVAQGRETASIVPTLGLFAVAAFRLMPSVNRVLSAVQYVRFTRPVINTLYDEIKSLAPEAARATSGPLEFRTEIHLDDVSFAYPGAAGRALNNVTLTIRRGESVGFIGPTGSGKSTLVDVVLGLLPPNGGRVIVDGQDIQENLRAWQDQIGYVSQSIYLTDDTIRRNVAFGLAHDEIDDAAVQRAVEAAQLDEFLATLPKGLETVVGERGIRLSGGQRQRIGIARALYHDPSVLVLDEATSALDIATEREVMKAFLTLRGDKTILIVAHRLSTVEHCDRLYKLVGGSVAEEGTPGELLRVPKVG
ncbi:MAG TPA: ABC transporter ATP-binding protein [Gemmatimonadaceae bacterium]|nr:ABC transporter ATP-binding protein [Gemmatimonadaceae bacterium]